MLPLKKFQPIVYQYWAFLKRPAGTVNAPVKILEGAIKDFRDFEGILSMEVNTYLEIYNLSGSLLRKKVGKIDLLVHF